MAVPNYKEYQQFLIEVPAFTDEELAERAWDIASDAADAIGALIGADAFLALSHAWPVEQA